MNINEWKKLILRGNILYDSNYRTLEKAKKKKKQYTGQWLPEGGGKGRGIK